MPDRGESDAGAAGAPRRNANPPGAAYPPVGASDPFTTSDGNRRYWDGLPTASSGKRAQFRRRRSRLGTALVLVGILEIVVVAGVITGWFGLPGFVAKNGATAPPGPTGPDPNPFHEKLNALYGEVSYSGNESGYFSGVDRVNLCSVCPALPFVDYQYSPPFAVVTVFFNLTNTGSTYHTATSFTLVAGSADASGVFELLGMYCCAPNNYDEDTEALGVSPGMTWSLEAIVVASSIPSNGGQGY
ncbi:MAG: hypothetical protein L3K17_09530, partial [Thermoplasmata archaeon]|nr:hypothetical protein [Thermoplasmata archaeon]